jgi:cellulose synthase (UDP-forming)
LSQTHSKPRYSKVADQARSVFRQGLTGVIFLAAIFLTLILANMTMPAQAILSAVLFAFALLLGLKRHSETVRLMLLLISVVAAARYITWRLLYTLSLTGPVEGTVSMLLFLAECYTIYTLLGFYFQTLVLDHSQDDAITDPSFTPTVDVFICSLDESVDIVRRTVSGALAIDYPNKQVYILDDGRREEMKQLASDLGCGYFRRPDNKHAKAGNVNNALPQTNGELILFLDADQIPVRTILRRTVHVFKDPKMALMQTAHRTLNAGPVERNLYLEGILPNEQELFFQLVQVGSNFWNAAFFCGSSAVIRRSILLEVGNMATETVTEDSHTSLRMHEKGYKSRYYSRPLSVGLSPESLYGWIVQHCRWARGVTQMLRVQNPYLQKGLTWQQRYCYFNGMIHFWFGIPRIIFYMAPCSYLIFGIHPVRVSFVDYIAMAIPYIFIASWANNYIFKNFRHSYWSDVYEALLAAPYFLTVLWALADPRTGKFNVTPKGTIIRKSYLDWISAPNIVILLFLLISVIFGFNRLNHKVGIIEEHAIWINMGWTFYNLFTIVPAILCALEHAFTKRAHPIRKTFAVEMVGANNNVIHANTETITEFYGLLNVNRDQPMPTLQIGDDFQLAFRTGSEHCPELRVSAKIKYIEVKEMDKVSLGVEFINQDLENLRSFIEVIYCDESMWATLREPEDSFVLAFKNLVTTPWRVFINTRRWLFHDRISELTRTWQDELVKKSVKPL